MRDRVLEILADLAIRRPRLVLGLALLIAVLSGAYAAAELRMNANTDDLIAPDRPYMKRYRAFIDEFGDLESIFAVVAAPPGREAEARTAVDELAARIATHPELPRPHCRIEAEEQTRLAAWNMDLDQLRGLVDAGAAIGLLRAGVGAEALARDALGRAEELGRSILPGRQRELGASLVLSAQALSALVQGGRGERELGGLLVGEPRYLVSETGRLHFVELLPAKDYGTLEVIERPLELLRLEIAAVMAAHPDLEIGLTGKPVLQADEMKTTDRDMTRSSIVAIVLVALLFMLVIGNVRRPFLAVVTLLIAITWTFGLTTLVIGQLNLLSIVFTLILVGIGIDFGVHVIARYQEERSRAEREPALRAALRQVGRGNTSGAITTSLAFFMALLTDFRGLQELGFVAGTGIVLCLLAMSVVLPALLVLFDRGPVRSGGRLADLAGRLEPRFLFRRPILSLSLFAALTLAVTPFVELPGFSGNVLELQATGLDSVRWEHRVLEDSAAASWFGAAIADDLDQLQDFVTRARGEDAVGEVLSALDFVPRPEASRRELLDRLVTAAARPELQPTTPEPLSAATTKELARALRALAGKAEGLAPAEEVAMLAALALDVARIARTLESDDDAALERFRGRVESRLAEFGEAFDLIVDGAGSPIPALLPEALRHRLVAPSGRYLASIHPRQNVWDIGNMKNFVAALHRVDAEVTGVPLTHYLSIIDMHEGFERAALYALAAVLLVVGLDFRRGLAIALAVTPLVIGAIWLLQAMGLFGISFNLANFFSVPILIGIGVDNGIHLVHRFREGGPDRLRFSATHRGVFLTSATSLIGFGCLAFASHRGLQSLGLVMAMGCAACLLAALSILPSLLALVDRRNRSSGL